MPKRQKTAMMPSKKIETTAPESERQMSVKSFRNTIRVMDGTKLRISIAQGDEGCEGLFSLLSDDSITMIMWAVLTAPKSLCGLSYFDEIDRGMRAIFNMALSCRRLASVLNKVCPELQAEALARKCTRVLPQPRDHELGFTRQMRNELLSCDHLKMLRAAQGAMALHCAKDCCKNVQRAFNKDIRKGVIFSRPSSPTMSTCAPEENQLLRISDNCSIIEANEDGNCAFMYARERLSKLGVHGEARGRRFRDVIAKVEINKAGQNDPKKAAFVRTAVLEIDADDMSGPLTIRTSPDGNYVAFIRAKHDVDVEAYTPFSVIFLWHVGWESAIEITPSLGCDVRGDSLSAQDAWFRVDDKGDTTLTVAWSTDYYHPSGHRVGSNVSDERDTKYMFSSYSLDEDEDPDHFESTFAESGSLLTCSPCSNGNKVCTLVKRRDVMNGYRCVYMHDLNQSRSFAVTSTYVNAGAKGPVAAAVSPAGDIIVVICKVGKCVTTNVCWQTGDSNYAPVAGIDVSHWVGLYADNDPVNFTTDLVKASVEMKFSSCGRFVAIVDRHPFFGSRPENHGVVILDTVMRGKTNKFRPFPLFGVEDQAPRSFQWTKQGIWLMPPGMDANGSVGPRGGALCLFAPTNTSFM